jgi:hypothetical protein
MDDRREEVYVDEEDAKEVLERQLSVYKFLRSQTLDLLRLLVAAVALIAAAAAGGLFSGIFSSISTFNTTAAYINTTAGMPLSPNEAYVFGIGNVVASAFLILSGIFLFIFSMLNYVRVLRAPNFEPVFNEDVRYTLVSKYWDIENSKNTKSIETEKYSPINGGWLNRNKRILINTKSSLETGQSSIFISFVMISSAAILILSYKYAEIAQMVLYDTLFILSSITLLILTLKNRESAIEFVHRGQNGSLVIISLIVYSLTFATLLLCLVNLVNITGINLLDIFI